MKNYLAQGQRTVTLARRRGLGPSLAVLGLSAACAALGLPAAGCGGDAGAPAADGNPGGSDGTGNAGTGGGDSGSGAGGSASEACVASECADVPALGTIVPGCCQLTGVCGALLSLMGTSFCGPPNVDDITSEIGDRFEELEPETIVDDAECPGQTLFGTAVSGCCDATGVCGLSTVNLAGGAAATLLRIDIPVSCVVPTEAVELGAGIPGGAVGASANVPCGQEPAPPAVDAGLQVPDAG